MRTRFDHRDDITPPLAHASIGNHPRLNNFRRDCVTDARDHRSGMTRVCKSKKRDSKFRGLALEIGGTSPG